MRADPGKAGVIQGPAPDMTRGGDAVAVVLAVTPAAGLRCADGSGSLLERLTRQLITLPVRDVQVVARPDGPRLPDPEPRQTGLPRLPHPRQPNPGEPHPRRPRPRPPEADFRLADTVSGGLAEDLRIVARTARAGTSPVIVLAADVVAHTDALAALLADPSYSTGALIGQASEGEQAPLHPPVRTERGLVVSAGNSFHRVGSANGTFRGVLRVGEEHLASLAEVAEELAELAEHNRLGSVRDAEVPGLLLTGLVRAGVPVQAVPVGALRCERVADQAAAETVFGRLAEVDEGKARLDAAIKSGDGFFTTFFVSSWSRHAVRLAAWLGLTPNAVTGISFGLALIAAIWFSDGHRTGLVVGAAALYLSFVLDCVDGQLARYTRQFSPIGGWFDAICDRGKEYVVFAGLAFGYQAQPGEPGGVWSLAVGALILQVVRHMVDFGYSGALADAGGGTRPRRPLAVPRDEPAMTGAVPARAEPTVSRGRSATYWLRKIIILPIGERTALIAITAALFDARVTFLALLGWGALALAYTSAGRIVRSFA